MKNKLLICTIIYTIFALFMFNYSFATNNQDNSVNLGNTISESLNKTGESAHNVVNTVSNGAGSVGNMVSQGAGNIGNSMQNTMNNGFNSINTNNGTNNVGNDYTATRTSDDAQFAGMNSTSWIWLIMAVVAVVIIGLVWYYAVQNTNTKNS